MTPELVGAIFTGATGFVTVAGGLYLTAARRRGASAAEVEAWQTWGVRMRRYVAGLRVKLEDRGVATDDPPPMPGEQRDTPPAPEVTR